MSTVSESTYNTLMTYQVREAAQGAVHATNVRLMSVLALAARITGSDVERNESEKSL